MEKKETILIVDDTPNNLRILSQILSDAGYIVRPCPSGKLALKAARAQIPSLILLDIVMPEMDGYEVCKILKTDTKTENIPILFISALDDLSNKMKAFEVGGLDYITKPFHAGEVLARIKTHLELQRVKEELTDNFNQMELEFVKARQTQELLMSRKFPSIPEVDVDIRYRSMTKVGGDYYDFFYEDGHLGILIADVSGHGAAASLIVSIVKIVFYYQKNNMLNPSLLLQNMNEAFYGNIGKEFVTATYLLIDLKKQKITVANAAHPPLLLLREGSKEIIQILPRGTLLGIKPDAKFQSLEIDFQPKDRLLLYTDGLIEAPNESNEMYDEERLADFLRKNRNLKPSELSEKLMKEIIDWSGGELKLEDDIMIITIDNKINN
ncbi:MAG: SpoIIE family protein phosphatase [Leptospiraceae bacterium]|nr:SpoIIE family protein phosphatase [Leptospiraceae bacterium]MCP5510341.1 SpoIIE family protein phosphatase [Leptospiraceae bacterium]